MTHTSKQAYRPSTQQNQIIMHRTYLSFCLYFGLQDLNPDPTTLCLYIEFLKRTFQSPNSIINYVSSINTLHAIADCPPPKKTFAIASMIRATKLTMRHYPKQMRPITPQILLDICDICDQQGASGMALKAAFLMLYFTFIRQSNIAPRHHTLYDHTRHLARADIFMADPGYVVLIKWSKTLQTGQHALIPVPQIQHRHCPVQALTAMLRTQPESTDQQLPLFIAPNTNNRPMTSRYMSDALRIMLSALNIQPNIYSLHSFRRGGATAAYQAGVNYAQVKSHGTWASDSFWNYITVNTLNSDVPNALARDFQ